MNQSAALRQAAEKANISDHYISAGGAPAHVKEETIYKMLALLGYDISDDEHLLQSVEKKHKQPVLAPVLVVREGEHGSGESIEIAINIGQSARESEFNWKVETEEGDVYEGYLQSQITRDDRHNGGPLVFSIPGLPLGYHRL